MVFTDVWWCEARVRFEGRYGSGEVSLVFGRELGGLLEVVEAFLGVIRHWSGVETRDVGKYSRTVQ